MWNKRILILTLLFFVFVIGTASTTVSAATPLYVNGAAGDDTYDGTSATYNTGTIGPKKTIQNAINTVTDGGVVNVANGVYNEHLTINKNMTLNGASRGNTILDGTHNGRIIQIAESQTVYINHVTLRNGNSTSGGAILNFGTLTISDSTLSENTGNDGGAIYNYGTLTISGSTLNRNTAEKGGAIYNQYNQNVHISGSILSENHAGVGGAIFTDQLGTLSISGSTLNGNTATGDGGAINIYKAKAYISGSTLNCNTATGDGGAIDTNIWSTLSISGSTLNGNTAEKGGAIYNEYYCTNSISSSTLSGNTATGDGGAIHNELSTLSISGSTLNGNTAGKGGAIYNYWYSKLSISGSIINRNFATDEGSAIYNKDYSTSIVKFNQIVSNSPTIALVCESGSIDARYNWWGSNANPSGKVTSGVTYSPWLVSPKAISTNPKNKSKKVSRTQTLYIKFSNKIKASNAWSQITVKKNGKKISIKKWIKGNILYIKTKKRSGNSYYTIYIPKYSVKNYNNINLMTYYSIKFKTK